MDEILVKNGLKLRLVSTDFAEEAFGVVEKNREHLERWLPWVHTTITVANEWEYFETSARRHKEGKCMEMGVFLVDETCRSKDWKFVGMCGLVNINRPTEDHSFAEIGYWLCKEQQGKGIITSCCKKLIEVAFEELNLEKIKLMAHKDNHPSISIAKRLGLQRTNERLLRPDAQYHDDIENVKIFATTKAKWKSSLYEH